jgi:hypothetical protein
MKTKGDGGEKTAGKREGGRGFPVERVVRIEDLPPAVQALLREVAEKRGRASARRRGRRD